MSGLRNRKAMRMLGTALLFLGAGALMTVHAANVTLVSGVGQVAHQVTSNFANIAKLITAGAYIAGLGFGVGAILKFKAHKDNPTQVQLSVPIAMLFIGAALMFAPSVFKSAGGTLYTGSAVTGGVSGVSGIT